MHDVRNQTNLGQSHSVGDAVGIANVLTIAGVDPSGGAGVLADVKAMSALGVFATAVVAALTAQNTQTVTGVLPVDPSFVVEQIDTLYDDVRIDAVKIGMLGSVNVIEAVAAALSRRNRAPIVLDTVMVAKSGAKLMPDDAVEAFIRCLLPMASVITPNLPEAGVLLGRQITKAQEMPQAAVDLYELTGGLSAVYLKGGHLGGDRADDLFYDGEQMRVLKGVRTQTKNTHGTGCSLSSAIAALIPQSDSLFDAAVAAKQYISEAIAAADALSVGQGHGPVHHFVRMWKHR